MTDYDTLRVKVGGRPITMVEIDLDFCGLTYGVAPCTAALGTTGSQKCFNTFKTCQAPGAYTKGVKTYRFCSANAFLPIGETIFPYIEDVDIAPTQLKPSGFSVSASVTVTLRDFPYHDRGVDPYAGTRGYDQAAQGSFFGKLRARNPYLVNRVMRVNTGYVDADRTVYTKTRTYFIDRMEGPDANGVVKLIGKDLLRFAETDKAEAPVTSKGALGTAITAADTSLMLQPMGIGAEYPSSGTVRVGDELIQYTGKSGDQLFGFTRGSDGTAPASHDADDAVQLCIRYTMASVPSVIADLLTTYAGISSSRIPLPAWEDEASTWLAGFTISHVLSKPEGVRKLVESLLESAACSLWWDELDAVLRFKAIVPQPPSGAVPVFDETRHILAGSLKVKDQEKDRISRVVMYLGLSTPVKDVKKENFRFINVTVDVDGESSNAYGTSATEEILSRWVPNRTIAQQISSRLLARYQETPREVTLRVDAKDHTLRTGDLVDVTSRLIQNPDGSPGYIRYIVTEEREAEVGTHYEYVLLQVSSTGVGKLWQIAPDTLPDWTTATASQQQTYMFISDDAGVMSDLQPGPRIN
ncbi:hypothetical protein [Methylorubrum sp. SB2]|uniref:hypothetical protein n=1 Tax=Methylorubrum subtropicum TaxID=3138812 RepID=UPI00313ED542